MEFTVNDEARAALLAEVKDITDEKANERPKDGGWSINQVLEHLYLMEDMVVKMLDHALKTGEVQEAKKRRIEATVNRDIKVDAPDELVPSDEALSIETIKDNLSISHKKLEDFAQEHSSETLIKKALPHPAFGLMSLEQWIPFVGYHEVRHTEQIREIKADIGG